MNHDARSPRSTAEVVSTHSVFGAPCWVSLTSRDLEATQEFYTAVLGWRWRPAKLGDRFRIALAQSVPVAGIGAVASMWQMAVAWTPYFAVPSADEAVARVQERGGTAAVGPLSLPPGRAALLADRDGATFGVWEGELISNWETWRRAAPTFIRLHTRDAFDAAMFYGEVLDWATERPGCCEVRYEGARSCCAVGAMPWRGSSRGRWRLRRTRRFGRTGRFTSRWRTSRSVRGRRSCTGGACCRR